MDKILSNWIQESHLNEIIENAPASQITSKILDNFQSVLQTFRSPSISAKKILLGEFYANLFFQLFVLLLDLKKSSFSSDLDCKKNQRQQDCLTPCIWKSGKQVKWFFFPKYQCRINDQIKNTRNPLQTLSLQKQNISHSSQQLSSEFYSTFQTTLTKNVQKLVQSLLPPDSILVWTLDPKKAKLFLDMERNIRFQVGNLDQHFSVLQTWLVLDLAHTLFLIKTFWEK